MDASSSASDQHRQLRTHCSLNKEIYWTPMFSLLLHIDPGVMSDLEAYSLIQY